jgi:hypothetical protein
MAQENKLVPKRCALSVGAPFVVAFGLKKGCDVRGAEESGKGNRGRHAFREQAEPVNKYELIKRLLARLHLSPR